MEKAVSKWQKNMIIKTWWIFSRKSNLQILSPVLFAILAHNFLNSWGNEDCGEKEEESREAIVKKLEELKSENERLAEENKSLLIEKSKLSSELEERSDSLLEKEVLLTKLEEKVSDVQSKEDSLAFLGVKADSLERRLKEAEGREQLLKERVEYLNEMGEKISLEKEELLEELEKREASRREAEERASALEEKLDELNLSLKQSSGSSNLLFVIPLSVLAVALGIFFHYRK